MRNILLELDPNYSCPGTIIHYSWRANRLVNTRLFTHAKEDRKREKERERERERERASERKSENGNPNNPNNQKITLITP